MSNNNLLNVIRDRFIRNNDFLKGISSYVNKRESSNIKIDNRSLAIAASRVTVPQPFTPYIQYIENSTKKPFNTNLQFSVDEVRVVDLDIINSFRNPNFDFSKINIDYLIRSGYQSFLDLGLNEQDKCSQIRVEDSISQLPRNTSAGFPTFKRKDNFNAIQDAVSWANKMIENPTIKDFLSQPTAVFHRFQYKTSLRQDNTELVKKIRPVWGVSFRILAFEGWLFRDLLNKVDDSCKRNPLPCTTLGRTKSEISRDIISHIRKSNGKINSIDYSLYDSTIPSFMWALFYSIVPNFLKLDKISQSHLDCLMSFHCFTPYCWNSTVLKYQRKGVPSGCTITTLFNTWVNRTIINYSCLEYTHGKFFAGSSSFCLGDDLLFTDEIVTLKHFLNVVKRFGMVVNEQKCSVSNPLETFSFLGYNWDKQNRPTETLEWYIAHLCLPSRFYRDYPFPVSVLQTYRGISICMGLYNGMETFDKLIGFQDFVYKDLIDRFKRGEDPIINYVGEDQRLYYLRIPLSVIFNEGWEAF